MKKLFSRKDSIILSAIEILDELGVPGLSTKEIAHRQGIAESALYRHYKNKDSILVAVLEYFMRYDKAILSTIQNNQWDAVKSIQFFLITYAEHYENYPAITAIFGSLSTFSRVAATKKLVRTITENYTGNLTSMVKQGQERGEIKPYFTPNELATVLYGTFRMIIMEWRINGYNFSLKERVATIIGKVLSHSDGRAGES